MLPHFAQFGNILIRSSLRFPLPEIDVNRTSQIVRRILEIKHLTKYSIAIDFCSPYRIQKLNSKYRSSDNVTDILSFPPQKVKAGTKPKSLIEHAKLFDLGGLVICPFYVQKCKHLGNTMEARLNRLCVHGLLHLLGYDHETYEDEKRMIRQEKQILKKIGTAASLEALGFVKSQLAKDNSKMETG